MKFIKLLILSAALMACKGEEQQSNNTPSEPKVENIIEYHPNGKLKKKGTLVDGKRDGVWEAYFENGLLQSRHTYSHGIDNGAVAVYYENGAYRYKGLFNMGKKYGEWVSYNEQGDTAHYMEYNIEGELIKEIIK